MLIVQVNIQIKEEFIDRFIAVTKENAAESIKETGIARFDVLQNQEDPSKFILMEAYRSEAAPAEHKKTNHYNKWKTVVEEMMVEPRYSIKFSNILPEDNSY